MDDIESYLDYCRSVRRLSPHSLSAYKADLCQFAAESAKWGSASPEAIRSCLERIASNERLAPRTIKRKIASVRAYLRCRSRALATKTFDGWKLAIRLPAQLPRTVSRPDMAKLLDEDLFGTEGGNTTFLCLLLMAATGLRISELCSLRPQDVRSSTGEIIVRGKGARERIVIVANRAVLARLSEYIASISTNLLVESALFRNRRGNAMTPQCLRLRLRGLARRAEILSPVTPHMFRHTAATMLLEEGVDIRFVQKLLGHASILTTQMYTHVNDAALTKALKRADTMSAFV